jgi:predicted metal-dependent peptidase
MEWKKELENFLNENNKKKILAVFDYSGSLYGEKENIPFEEITDVLKDHVPNMTVGFLGFKILETSNVSSLVYPTSDTGGTDFVAAFDWAKENGAEAVVIVTDGWSSAPGIEPIPTFWALVTDQSTIPFNAERTRREDDHIDWGKQVKIENIA